MPRTADGFQFVAYGDCCVTMPDSRRRAEHERVLANIHATMQRLRPAPEFICFLGDAIAGTHHAGDEAGLRAEWEDALNGALRPLAEMGVPVYRIGSNHDTFDAASERVWQQVFPDIPRNGPPGQEGLTWYERRGNRLLVGLHVYPTAMGANGSAGGGRVDLDWLRNVLDEHRDARYKLVMGHAPVFPVNGYTDLVWLVNPAFGEPLWELLAERGAQAYLCSHVIAFDAQEHRGVMQITTGGAGTKYGPGGCMDAPEEYHHLVQIALDKEGIRGQAIDDAGRVRESFSSA